MERVYDWLNEFVIKRDLESDRIGETIRAS